MNTSRPVYVTKYNYVSDGSYLMKEWNNGYIEILKFFEAGYTNVYTFPVPFTNNPYVLSSFLSTRADRSYDKELCCFNLSHTSCEFSNFSTKNSGGQGGFVWFLGRKA